MARPTDNTLALATSGNRSAPGTGLQADGYEDGDGLPATQFNYLVGEALDWISFWKEAALWEATPPLADLRVDPGSAVAPTYGEITGTSLDTWTFGGSGILQADVTDLIRSIITGGAERALTHLNVQWVPSNAADALVVDLVQYVIDRNTPSAPAAGVVVGTTGTLTGGTSRRWDQIATNAPLAQNDPGATPATGTETAVRYVLRVTANITGSILLEHISLQGQSGRVE